MKRIILIAAGAFLGITGIGAGAVFYLRPGFLFAQPPAGEPSEADQNSALPDVNTLVAQPGSKRRSVALIERLGVVQDRIAHGDRLVLGEQKQLLADTGAAIRYYEKRDWQDFASVRAAFIYVLSGGNPSVLKPFITGEVGNEADRKFAEGILRFAKGQTKNASKLIDAIDPRTLDTSLIGPFALARGSLHLEDDPAAAIAFLDEARLASPHTAIEEAALRREIPLLVASGEITRGIILAADYTHRFGQSIYARKLFTSFGAALSKHGELDQKVTFDSVLNALNPKDSTVNAEILIEIAGQSLLRGRLDIAKRAAAEVLRNPSSRPTALEKAKLYQAAADAPSGDAGEALKALGDVAADKLSDDDAQIFDAAGYIAQEVRGNEMPLADTQNASVNVQPAKDVTGEHSPIGNDLIRVSGALSEADAALNQADLLASRTAK